MNLFTFFVAPFIFMLQYTMDERGYSQMSMERSAGILCPLFSVPANQGIGDLGQKTIKMIDYIADGGFHVWQILPLAAKGAYNSPYHTQSSFAGDPIYINLDRLCEMGLLTQSSLVNCNKFKERVDYPVVREFKERYFQRAFKAFKKNYESFQESFEAFEKEAFWLNDWVIYVLFKELNEKKPWYEWEEKYRDYPLKKDVSLFEYEEELFYYKFLQYIFYKQFDDIMMYAHARKITIISDVAFVNYDSADVWAHREDFLLDADGCPKRMGDNAPVHNFKKQQEDGYIFWKQRMKWVARCMDMAKVDYFTVFHDYLKAYDHLMTVDQTWLAGVFCELVELIRDSYPNFHLIVEGLEEFNRAKNLDVLDIKVLLDHMWVKELKKETQEDIVLYTSTQNYPTVNEAYYSYDNNHRISLRRFFKKRNYTDRNFNDLICQYALKTQARLVILPIWDICGYKEETRIQGMTEASSNWTWKLKDFKSLPEYMEKVKQWIEESDR